MEVITAGYLEAFEIVIGGYCSMACAELNNSWFYHHIEQKGGMSTWTWRHSQ